jgi:carboxyl-terminal processing protease
MRLIAAFLLAPILWTLNVDQAGAVDGDIGLFSSRHTNATPLIEGSKDTQIVQFVSQILMRQHYLRMPINDDVSSKFLDRYLDSTDNLHIYFTQADLQEFEKYRFQLDELTVKDGNTTAARLIFNRFRERLAQQHDYVQELLKAGKFDFTGNDRFIIDRKKQPRPRDLNEARQLWKDRLRYEYLQEKLNKVTPEDIVKNLTKRYTRVLRMLNEYDNDDVLQIYLTALCRVYDPHSDYMIKSELENFSIGMKLSLFGIGALLQSEDGICKIRSLTDGGPAQRSKQLKPDDKIIAVAQSNGPPVDVVDMKLNKVVELIRGPKATEVRLTIIPADAPNSSERKIVSLIRDEIKLEDSAAKARIYDMPLTKKTSGGQTNIRLGVIDLPSFYSAFELEGRRGSGEQKSTTVDVAKLLRKLTKENISGVILDLRRNGGGSLEEAINLTGLFIKEGPVVQVRDFDGRVFKDEDTDTRVLYDGPLIVLTSRFSASASEILAGALQDYGRALVVGDSSTHGKGTVQSLLQLAPIMRQNGMFMTNNPGAIKVTIRKFYRASGASTQLKGVTPDIILPAVNNYIEVGEASLENPLEWDTIPAASYEVLNRVEPSLAELKKRSDERIAKDADYEYIRGDIQRFRKALAEKSVSLNEAVRLKEKKENDERAKARKKELAARPEPPGKIYDITLKLVEEPGLPAPTVRTNTITGTNSIKSAKLDKPAKADAKATTTKKDKPSDAAHTPKDEDEEDDAAVAAVDVQLDETKRILIDYVQLLSGTKK